MASEEMVQLSLNHQGKDILITAPYSTALLLLNDADAASQFLNNLQEAREPLAEEAEEHEDSGGDNSLIETGIDTDDTPQEQEILWTSRGKPSACDHEATLCLLKLRAKYGNKFDDKKTHNSAIWQMIANEMTAAGFNVGTKNPGEKCRQKFANLQNKMYYPHLRHMQKTGAEKKETPLYFVEVHDILGSKHKANPQHLQDTLSVSSCETEASTSSHSSQGPQEKETIKNRFARTVQTCKPVGVNAQLMEMMKEENTYRRQQMDRLTTILEQQNKQRDRMLDILSDMSRKRKRRESAESSDSD